MYPPEPLFSLIAAISTCAGFVALGLHVQKKCDHITVDRLTQRECGLYLAEFGCYLVGGAFFVFWLWGNWIELTQIGIGLSLFLYFDYFHHPQQHDHRSYEAVPIGDYLIVPGIMLAGGILVISGVWGFFETPPPWLYVIPTLLFLIAKFYNPPPLMWRM